jgi:hypothetical protein
VHLKINVSSPRSSASRSIKHGQKKRAVKGAKKALTSYHRGVYTRITPIRGSIEDWSGTNQYTRLLEQQRYATEVLKQQQRGRPKFDEIS